MSRSANKAAQPKLKGPDQRASQEPASPRKPLTIGRMRSGAVLVRLFGDDDDIAASYTLGCTAVSGYSRISASQCPGTDEVLALDHLQQKLSVRTQMRLAARPHHRDLAFQIDASTFYQGMSLRRTESNACIEWATRDTSLRSLLPGDREAFRERLSFEVRRHIDLETVRFVTSQVLRVNTPLPTTVETDTLGYLINTFVIHAYKCAEIGQIDDVARCPDVRRMVFHALARMSPAGDGVRDDPDHLFVSVHTALWHLAIARHDEGDAIESLSAIFWKYKQGEGSKLPVNYSYNFCLSLLFYGILLHRKGLAEEAKRSFWATIECFRRAVATGTKNATWFREMGDSHAAAANAFEILDRLRRQEAFEPDFLVEMSEAALRVRSLHFKAATARMIQSPVPRS